MTDPIHPAHYKTHASGVECIELAEAFPFSLGNAIKYLWRCGEKGDVLEDLGKALWYLDRAMDGGGPKGPSWMTQARNILAAKPDLQPSVVAEGFDDWRVDVFVALFDALREADESHLWTMRNLVAAEVARLGGPKAWVA